MESNICVRCTVTTGGDEKVFTKETEKQQDLSQAKAVEVTTEHPAGPLQSLLGQLESVQVQSNHCLTQLIQAQTNPARQSGEKVAHKKR